MTQLYFFCQKKCLTDKCREKIFLFFFLTKLKLEMGSRLFLGTYYGCVGQSSSEIIEFGKEWEELSKRPGIKGVAGQLEKCPTTGRLHWQFIFRTEKSVGFKKATELIGTVGAHVEKFIKPKGKDILFYVHKDETSQGHRFNFGELESSQGKRNDLSEIKDDIMNGKDLDDIVLKNPFLYHQYGRTLEKIESIALKRNKRTNMTKGLYLWGTTGVGKSHEAYTNYGDDYYTWVKDSKFQCGYKQQKVVIINEFRGELKLSQLLDMVDKWEFKVERKGKDAIPFNSELVIITSSIPPEEIFEHALSDNDRFDQFKRRFEIRKLITSRSGPL